MYSFKRLGIVSLWLATCENEEKLESFLDIEYSDDGDFNGSYFTKVFKIDFDEDFIESEFRHSGSDNIDELLKGFSHDSTIIEGFRTAAIILNKKYNSVILIYDFYYSGGIKEANINGVYIKYFGSTSYRK